MARLPDDGPEYLRAITAVVSAGCLFVTQSAAYALPQGGQVNGGQASITSGSGQMTIDQSSQRALIDWQSFNIGGSESVNFNQPSSTAIALNRIHDVNPSQIDGALIANGQVWLVNSQGIAFGAGASVNVGGLLATSSNISDDRFMNGDYTFDMPGNPAATISNAGRILAGNRGLVTLAGPKVVNTGVIQAELGKVELASGDSLTLDLYGDGLISLEASDAVLDQLVDNRGSIVANGGHVLLTAAAAENAVGSLINMEGTIEAITHEGQAGTVTMFNAGGTTLVSGTVSARGEGAGNKGGLVSALGRFVGILSGASIDTSGHAGGGTILAGGDYLGQGTVPTAERTIVQGTTNLFSNATGSGDGGKVIVWSDDRTDFAGNIEARGGALAGDGGFVETSGKNILSSTGNVDASAANGKAGLWLLDPNNVTIQAAGIDTNVAGNPDFMTTDDSAIVTTGSIQTALNSGTSVSITTGSAGTNAQAGDITVSSAISKTAGGEATLTLSAHRNITVNAGISSTSDRLNLLLNADNTGQGSGYVLVNAAISSNGGNITMGGGSGPISAGSGYAIGNAGEVAGIRINNFAVSAGGGDIIVNGQGFDTTGNSNRGVRLLGTLETTGSGNINISGLGGGNTISASNMGVDLGNGGVISSVDGDIYVSGIGGGAAGSGNANRGVSLSPTSAVMATGSGNVSIIGTGGGTGGSGNGNYGVEINAGTVSTNTGDISITGTGGNSTGTNNFGISSSTGGVISTVDGDIAITARGGNGAIALRFVSGSSIGNGPTTGDIVLEADSINWNTGTLTTAGSVYIRPSSLGTSVGIAGGAGELSLPGTMLDSITAAAITIGRSDGRGAIVADAYSWGSNAVLLNGLGGISINGAQIMGGNTFFARTYGASDISLGLGGSISSGAADTAITIASGRNFANYAGPGALVASAGRWLVYTTNFLHDRPGALVADFRRFACSFQGACPAFPSSGNGFLHKLSFVESFLIPNGAEAYIHNSPKEVFAPHVTIRGLLERLRGAMAIAFVGWDGQSSLQQWEGVTLPAAVSGNDQSFFH